MSSLAAPTRVTLVDEEIRAEFQAVRGEMSAMEERLRREIAAGDAETRRHMGVLTEGLRHDVQVVAEGVVMANEAIERLRGDVRRELDERFELMRLGFEAARRHTDGVAETLRQEIRVVADGLDATNRSLDEFRVEVRQNFDEFRVEVRRNFDEFRVEVRENFDEFRAEVRENFGRVFASRRRTRRPRRPRGGPGSGESR